MTGDGFIAGLARASLVVLGIALLAGCSMVRLGYNQLDSYAEWKADDYFDLDPAQKQEFARRFERLHRWHRYEQLPDYAAFLGSVGGRLKKGPAREDVLWITEGVKQRYRVIVTRGADDAAAMLTTVTPAQLDALRKQWEKDNRRFVREYRLDKDIDAQKHAHADRIVSRIRDWVGHLDDDQEKRIVALAVQHPLIHGLRYEDRLRRQREFLQMMAQRKDPRELAAKLGHWLANWEEGRDPQYDRRFREWEQKQVDFYLAVYRLLLPQQRAAVIERVRDYANDFTRLSQRPAAQAAANP